RLLSPLDTAAANVPSYPATGFRRTSLTLPAVSPCRRVVPIGRVPMSLNALNSWKLLPVWCGLGVLCAVMLFGDLGCGTNPVFVSTHHDLEHYRSLLPEAASPPTANIPGHDV